MEKYLDICDRCRSRELDFIFFDLLRRESDLWLKDVPGFRCRTCGGILASGGVIETVHEAIRKTTASGVFPMLQYQKRVLRLGGQQRDLDERYLHSWDIVRHEDREKWSVAGFRTFGDLKSILAV